MKASLYAPIVDKCAKTKEAYLFIGLGYTLLFVGRVVEIVVDHIPGIRNIPAVIRRM
tara:strand:- start:5164 stop:5334 length:171 start_codon:yes stop_codon:yes gene_type:complete